MAELRNNCVGASIDWRSNATELHSQIGEHLRTNRRGALTYRVLRSGRMQDSTGVMRLYSHRETDRVDLRDVFEISIRNDGRVQLTEPSGEALLSCRDPEAAIRLLRELRDRLNR